MFKEMRRKDKALSPEMTDQVLHDAFFGVISTMGDGNFPYGFPIQFVYDNKKIYFHCAKEGYKIEAFNREPKVSFTAVTDEAPLQAEFSTEFKSVICFGTIREVDGDERDEAYNCIMKKFSPDFPEEGKEYVRKNSPNAKVFCIDVEHMTGKGKY